MNLYLIVPPSEPTMLVNCPPDQLANVMATEPCKGGKAYLIGVSFPSIVPGVLAVVSEFSNMLRANMPKPE